MDEHIVNIKDLSDSKIMYNKKVPAFGYVIVLLVLTILLFLIVWSIVTPKSEAVLISGIIEGADKSYIVPTYGGEIIDVYVTEGQYVELGDKILSLKSLEIEMQLIQIEKNLDAYKEQLSQYQKLDKSIKEGVNLFDNALQADLQYYNEYCVYESKIAQKEVDYSIYEVYGYSEQQILQQIKLNQATIEEIYYSELQSIGERIDACKAQIVALEAQHEAYQYANGAYTLYAKTSGIVHLENYFQGMVTSAGNILGSIAPINEEYIIRASISVADMPRICENDKVEIAIDGLPQNYYGTMYGIVMQIGSDVSMSQDGEKTYFEVLIKPDQNYLINSNGQQVLIAPGMTARSWIEYDEITYFEWIVEKLGLGVR